MWNFWIGDEPTCFDIESAQNKNSANCIRHRVVKSLQLSHPSLSKYSKHWLKLLSKAKSPTKGPQNEIYTKLLIYLTSKNIIQIDDFIQMNLGVGLSSFTANLTSFKFSYLDLQVKNVILTEGFESTKEKVSPEF